MKYTIALFCTFFILNLSISAQIQPDLRSPVLKGSTHLSFTVIIEKNQLFLSCESESLEKKFISIKKPLLIDADLYLPFSINLPKDASHYQIRMELLNANEQLIAQKEKKYYTSGNKEMALPDITEKGLYLNQVYTLIIHHDLVGLYNCEAKRPEFNWDQKKWPVLISGLGLIGLATSETLLRDKQKASYQTYINLWESGVNETDDAKLSLKTANQAKDTRKALTYGSGALVVGGAIWYILKRKNIKKRQQRYDRYCRKKPTLSVTPDLINSAIGESLGLKLRYSF